MTTKRRILFFLSGVLLLNTLAMLVLPRLEMEHTRRHCRFELHLGTQWEERLPSGGEWRRTIVPQLFCLAAGERDEVWYRRTFFLPSSWRKDGGCVVLALDGVACTCEVFINDVRAGKSSLPDVPQEIDITDSVRWGSDNTLVLKVRNLKDLALFRGARKKISPKERSFFLHWASARLTGPVRLVITGPVRIKAVRAFLSPIKERLEVHVRLHNAGRRPIDGSLAATVLDGARPLARLKRIRAVLEPGRGKDLVISCPWPSDGKSWNVSEHGAPALYRLSVSFWALWGPADNLTCPIGVRDCRVEKGRLFLNGRPFFFRAATKDPISRYDAEPAETFLTLVGKGLNAFHTHYGYVPDIYFKRADEMGMAMLPELHCAGKVNNLLREAPKGERDSFLASSCEAWMDRLFNHPSILFWYMEDMGTPEANAACSDVFLTDKSRPGPFRKMANLGWSIYDFSRMDFSSLGKDPRAIFIGEFHETDMAGLPFLYRDEFLTRLSGAVFHDGALKSRDLVRCFAWPRARMQLPSHVRPRVVVKSDGARRHILLESPGEPGILRAWIDEGETDLGILELGPCRIGSLDGRAVPVVLPSVPASSPLHVIDFQAQGQ